FVIGLASLVVCPPSVALCLLYRLVFPLFLRLAGTDFGVLQEINFLLFREVGLIRSRRCAQYGEACENHTQNPSGTPQVHTSLLAPPHEALCGKAENACQNWDTHAGTRTPEI